MTMALSSLQNFLTGNPLLPIHKKHTKKPRQHLSLLQCRASASTNKQGSDAQSSGGGDHRLFPVARLALVAVAAGMLALGDVNDAEAAKSGGRVGGQAFRSSAPRSMAPRINNNSRTNIYINPSVAPPLVGGYSYGYGFPFGGWGWSPFTFFAPGPSIAVGFGGSFEIFAAILVLGVVTTVIRRFRGRSSEDDEDDYS